MEEYDKVVARAASLGISYHLGRVHELCFEKNPELEKGHKLRVYKVRVVFFGDQVKDQNNDIALFQEMSSSPATMEASKIADLYGLLEGHWMQMADAKSAYTQARLRGTPTFVELPRHMWPEQWVRDRMRRPVCPLILALYGHPQSGAFWEQHCEEKVESAGFIKLCEEWPSCFFHQRLRLLRRAGDHEQRGQHAHSATEVARTA